MKLKDVLKDKNHPLMVDVLRNEETSVGDELQCTRCEQKYKRSFWDFYSLCNSCFREFDAQKMQGRFSFGKIKVWHENAKEWAKDNPL